VAGDVDDLIARDAAALWHPATHFDDLEVCPPVAIVGAEGPWLHAASGARILDAIASWWTSVHGHRHPRVMAAIHRQVDTLDHVMFAGFTHAPAVSLAEGLLEAAGPAFSRVFFADSGSDAIEVALKLCLQFDAQAGAGRRRIAAFDHGYHGETLGALAACGSPTYRAAFADLLHDTLFLPTPSLTEHRHGDLAADAGAREAACDEALDLLTEHAGSLCALVVEPLVQCAGQMRMHGSGFLRRVVEHAQALGILVVADEIAVGLGRTGRIFAHAWSGVVPDALCLGKGLSGGALPLSAVVVSPRFAAAFRGAPSRAFAHSHTFCANPIAAAAGVASLALLGERVASSEVGASIAALDRARDAVARACPAVVASRQAGAIVAFDLRPHRRRPADGRIGLHLRAAALARGVLLRPLGDTLYWMPPLVLAPDALDRLVDATIGAIEEVLG
jgi:adenosylmethionine-8-amino-7-oxononanoate aminotransferase